MIDGKLRITLAMPTVNGGAYIFNGKHFQLYGDKGFTLIGGDNNEPDTKCYVHANPYDFLALMEERHKNSADKWCSEGQHIIVNGLDNLEDVAKYLNKRCDFSEVYSLLPHDDNNPDTDKIREGIWMATKGTVIDATYLYPNSVSIFGKINGRVIAKNDTKEKSKKVKNDVKQTLEIPSPEVATIKETVVNTVKEIPQKVKDVKEKVRSGMRM